MLTIEAAQWIALSIMVAAFAKTPMSRDPFSSVLLRTVEFRADILTPYALAARPFPTICEDSRVEPEPSRSTPWPFRSVTTQLRTTDVPVTSMPIPDVPGIVSVTVQPSINDWPAMRMPALFAPKSRTWMSVTKDAPDRASGQQKPLREDTSLQVLAVQLGAGKRAGLPVINAGGGTIAIT